MKIISDKDASFKWNFGLFVALVSVLGVFEFTCHEFWKDEWQAWFIAISPSSLAEMWSLLPVEGHPSGWFLVLRFVHWIAAFATPGMLPEHLIAGVHWILFAGVAWLFFMHFRFHYLLKLALAAGYFFFFEYGVVNRGYVLVILLLFGMVPFLKAPRLHAGKLAVLLLLLTQTEVYGLFAAWAIGLYMVRESLKGEGTWKDKSTWFPVLSLTAGTALFLYSVMPSGGMTGNATGTPSGKGLADAFQALFANTLTIGFIPPGSGGVTAPAILMSIALCGLILFVLRKQRSWMIAFACFTGMFLLFTAFVYYGGPRQWGMFYVFVLVVLNFAEAGNTDKKSYGAQVALLCLLIPGQLLHCFRVVTKEKKYLFSNAIAAGRYIRKNIPSTAIIIGINKPYCTPVIGYSGHPFYSLPDKHLFTYALFREKLYLPSTDECFRFADERNEKAFYLVSYKPLPDITGLTLVQEFDKPNLKEENYFLYEGVVSVAGTR